MVDAAVLERRLEKLNAEARDRSHPVVVPRDAATLILVDATARGSFRMLMGRRASTLKFMPGAWVFPGGSVDVGDRLAATAGDIDADMVETLLIGMRGRASRIRAKALAVAALRETFEESGILIGRPATPDRPAGLVGYDDKGQLPDVSSLRLVARAITPPGRIRRFDTRFFIADANTISHRPADLTPPSTELDQLAWIGPEDLSDVPVASITRAVIDEVRDFLAARAIGLPHPVPLYRWRNGRYRRDSLTG